jgi:hypothetical protein
MMMDSIIMDHRTTREAIPRSEGTYTNAYGVKQLRATTRAWELLGEWRDGLSNWLLLKDLKESYLIKLAVYVTDQGITEEPAFAWLVGPLPMKKAEIRSVGLVLTSMGYAFQRRTSGEQLKPTKITEIPFGLMQSNLE